MKLNISYHEDGHYIHAVSSGVVDKAAIELIASKMGAAVKSFDCLLILHDLRDTVVDLESYEIYNAPRLVTESGYQHSRRAVVFSSNRTDFTFFENVSANRGQNVKVFVDIDQARAWLLS